MAAFVGEGSVQVDTGLGVDARLGRRRLKNGKEKTFGLRMCNSTGRLALFTAYAPFGMHKNCFHKLFLSLSVVKKIEKVTDFKTPPF